LNSLGQRNREDDDEACEIDSDDGESNTDGEEKKVGSGSKGH
jgi:hypothetical protein